MAQLSLYMTEKDMNELKRDAKAVGKSISSYAREVIANRHQTERNGWKNGWPPGFFNLYGSAPDFPKPKDTPPEPVESW